MPASPSGSQLAGMWLTAGPSLQLAFHAAGTVGQLSANALVWAWRECHGIERATRKLRALEASGHLRTEPAPDGLGRIVRFTETGRRAALGGRDPEAAWSRPWDGRWRVIAFDVPEAQEALRARLRRALRGQHFGCLQRSVWITPDGPDAIRSAFGAERKETRYLTLLEALPCGGESHQDLVTGGWDFARINKRYSLHQDLLKAAPSGTSPGALKTESWKRWLKTEWISWTKIMRLDPLLPEPLLPAGYPGKQVWTKRQQVLAKAAISLNEVAS